MQYCFSYSSASSTLREVSQCPHMRLPLLGRCWGIPQVSAWGGHKRKLNLTWQPRGQQINKNNKLFLFFSQTWKYWRLLTPVHLCNFTSCTCLWILNPKCFKPLPHRHFKVILIFYHLNISAYEPRAVTATKAAHAARWEAPAEFPHFCGFLATNLFAVSCSWLQSFLWCLTSLLYVGLVWCSAFSREKHLLL